MTTTEHRMLQELSAQICKLVTAIASASEDTASLVLLAGIRKGLLKAVALQELTLPLFPKSENDES